MTSVTVRFSVLSVEVQRGMIVVKLQRVMKSEGTSKVIIQDNVCVDKGLSEEQQIAQRMGAQMMTTIADHLTSMVPMLVLTWEEYEGIGKPTVNDVLYMVLGQASEDADVQG